MLALPRKMGERVDAEILALADRPRPDGVVKLKATHGDMWRVRVGNFRSSTSWTTIRRSWRSHASSIEKRPTGSFDWQ